MPTGVAAATVLIIVALTNGVNCACPTVLSSLCAFFHLILRVHFAAGTVTFNSIFQMIKLRLRERKFLGPVIQVETAVQGLWGFETRLSA